MDINEKKDYCHAIEEMNMDYLRMAGPLSRIAHLNNVVERFEKNYPFHIARWMLGEMQNRYIAKKEMSFSFRKNGVFNLEYASPDPVEDKKGIVYSCIHGGYDTPKEPLIIDSNLRYVLYTDEKSTMPTSSWEYRDIRGTDVIKRNNSANRYYKMHPFEFFDKEDYAIYIDGNVQIISDVTGLYRIANSSKLGIAMHTHSSYESLYAESKWCRLRKRGNLDKIMAQVKYYKEQGFPEKYGHLEATVVVIDLKNKNAKQLLDAWWDEFCKWGSGRDQLSLPYVMWKQGYSIEDMGILGNFVHLNPKFRMSKHIGELF